MKNRRFLLYHLLSNELEFNSEIYIHTILVAHDLVVQLVEYWTSKTKTLGLTLTVVKLIFQLV